MGMEGAAAAVVQARREGVARVTAAVARAVARATVEAATARLEAAAVTVKEATARVEAARAEAARADLEPRERAAAEVTMAGSVTEVETVPEARSCTLGTC